ncbi:hypothetical protein [Bradyrhizobium sp. Ash2021]|uniref:hypothetical protein n=1 Tax=Bradyrhizobium sp. Ash2021 TaxID=2954771 RepID=UPI002815462D|nr:hypothetical protein [Bradyrhizobium sp. Ash2021]WMT73944.1 hypothetical protein NL528_39535 [Bradyrhizobium sp. Ash2021]
MAGLWARFCSLFNRMKTKEMDQVRDFVIEVGRAHMSCGLVEQQLHDLLRSFGYPDIDLPAWLAKGQHKKLKKAIDALKERFDFPSDFVSELHAFREKRNDFTHQIWADPTAKLEVGEGLEKMRRKVSKLYQHARRLSDIFGPLLLKLGEKRYQREAKRLDEEIKYWQRQSAILGAALAQSEKRKAQ